MKNEKLIFKYLLFLFTIFTNNVYSQNNTIPKNTVSIEINSCGGVGWWVYNKGWETKDQHRGYDRTHLSFIYATGASFFVENSRWQYGLRFEKGWLEDRVMITSEEQRGLGSSSRYRITDTELLHFQRFMFSATHFLYSKADSRFKTGPSLSLGIFTLNDKHPVHSRFGFQLSTLIGWQNIFRPKGGHFHFSIFPYYSKMRTFVKRPLKGEGLYLMDLGVKVSVGFLLLNRQKEIIK